MADLYNINIDAGSDYSLIITHEDSAGNPIDLTTYDARIFFKRIASQVASDAEYTVANGKLVIDGVNGIITLTIPNAETTALSDIYFYDLEIESAAGAVTRLMQGRVTISGEVTW